MKMNDIMNISSQTNLSLDSSSPVKTEYAMTCEELRETSEEVVKHNSQQCKIEQVVTLLSI